MIEFIVCFVAGMAAGLGTGFAGMSAAAAITPILVAFLDMPAYEAIGIALASDVLASGASACTYAKNKNIDIKNGIVMMLAVLVFTMVGSWVGSFLPNAMVGGYAVIVTILLGVRFILRPVMTTKENQESLGERARIVRALVGGIFIGFICGFVGAGGGMMMLLVLTAVLGYELKSAIGTSVFVMTFTAFTGAVSHFVIGGMPNVFCLAVCIISTLLWAQLASLVANKSRPIVLNRLLGVVLVVIGAAVLIVDTIE